MDEVCRQLGISQASLFNWKKKYGGLGISELRNLRLLEEENMQLKKLVTDLSLDKQMLQEVIKKALASYIWKEMSEWLVENYQVSISRACKRVLLARSIYYYIYSPREDRLLWMRINEIASTCIWFRFRRICTLLRREGFDKNHKRIYRIYKE